MNEQPNNIGTKKQRTTKQKAGRLIFYISVILFIISVSIGVYAFISAGGS